MAFRSTTFRSNLTNNENSLRTKEVVKLVNGPTIRRAALGDIGNKASLHITSDTTKLKQNNAQQPFKKPSMAKPKVTKKQTQNVIDLSISRENSVLSETLESVTSAPADSTMAPAVSICVPEDLSTMSVVESTSTVTAAEETISDDQAVMELSNAFSAKLLTVNDIDLEDRDNPQLVSEYVNEIYAYMRSLETKHSMKHRYLDGHTVTSRMRSILVDWLVQVHMRFNLMQETLFLAVAILDRYLTRMPNTPKDELQLVGVTAMFIASKYEEMYCSEIGDYVYITDKAYTKQQIRRMEVNMLKKLEFYISFPLPLHFLRRNSKAGQVDGVQHTLAKYLMELCLPDYAMCHYKASEIGAAALCLTMKLIGDEPEWTDTLVFYSAYNEAELTPIVCKMAQCIMRSHTSKQQSIIQKYRASKHMKISELQELKGPIIRSLSEKAATFC